MGNIPSFSFDEMANALADIQRRKLLVALLEQNPHDAPVVIGDSNGETVAVERLVEMHHVHLPKLAEYGFITWDQESHEVQRGPNSEEIRPLLKLLDDHEDELPPGWL